MAIQLYDAKAAMQQRRGNVGSGDYDPLRIGTPGYSEQLARGHPWDLPGDAYSDDRRWFGQETAGVDDYDPFKL